MDNFNKLLVNVIGDVMMSAGAVAYLGAFTVRLRHVVYSTPQYMVQSYGNFCGVDVIFIIVVSQVRLSGIAI